MKRTEMTDADLLEYIERTPELKRLLDALALLFFGGWRLGLTNSPNYPHIKTARAFLAHEQRILAQRGTEQPAVPEGKVLVPVAPTEAEIDAMRPWLLGMELGITRTAAMRVHLDNIGVDYSLLPPWFKTGDIHITKAGLAICLRAFMLSAASKPVKPTDSGGGA